MPDSLARPVSKWIRDKPPGRTRVRIMALFCFFIPSARLAGHFPVALDLTMAARGTGTLSRDSAAGRLPAFFAGRAGRSRDIGVLEAFERVKHSGAQQTTRSLLERR